MVADRQTTRRAFVAGAALLGLGAPVLPESITPARAETPAPVDPASRTATRQFSSFLYPEDIEATAEQWAELIASARAYVAMIPRATEAEGTYFGAVDAVRKRHGLTSGNFLPGYPAAVAELPDRDAFDRFMGECAVIEDRFDTIMDSWGALGLILDGRLILRERISDETHTDRLCNFFLMVPIDQILDLTSITDPI